MSATSSPDRAVRQTALPRLDPLRPRGTVRPSRRGRWRAASLVLVHLLILGHVLHWLATGTTLTPVEPSESMQTLELGYVNAGFLLFVALILATAVFGRFFCGWACHLVAYQDLCAWLLKKVGLKPRPVRSRLLVAVPYGVAFYMFFWPTLVRWLEARPAPDLELHLTTSGFWDTFPGPGMAVLTIAVTGFLVVWWLGAKGFCTYGCPYGAFFAAVEPLAPGRILVTDACEGCAHCTAVCTSNVRVHEEVAQHGMVVDPGCMKCMDCVSVCPKEALYYGRGTPPVLRPGRWQRLRARLARWWQGRGSRRSDFSWGEELLMAAVFTGAVCAFHGLYGLVPLLLSAGLAVLVAVAAVVLLRLVRWQDLAVQHWTLKRQGRFSPAGRAALVLLPLALVFTAHSGFVQWHAARGEAAVKAYFDPGTAAEERPALLAAGLEHLDLVDRFGLRGDPDALRQRGLLRRERGLLQEARKDLEASHRLDPGRPATMVPLADLRMAAGEREAAVALLRQVLAKYPEHGPARLRLQRLGLLQGR